MYLRNISLIQKECIVTNVIYPTRLPHNQSDMAGFATCDCGKRCLSDLGICISVFGNIINGDDNILFKDSIKDDYLSCTYHEFNCLNGENIQDRLEAISGAKDIAEQYIEMMNTTINCYLDKTSNQLYFSDDFNKDEAYVVFGLFIFFTITLICLCYCPASKPKEMTTIEQNEISFHENTVYNNLHQTPK